MIIYSVQIEISKQVENEWLAFMEHHVKDVLDTGCFSDFNFRKELESKFNSAANNGNNSIYRLEYITPSLSLLDTYFARYAVELQNQHNERFAGRFSASRSVYENCLDKIYQYKSLSTFVPA